jgi:hypothetical protein
MSLEDGGRERAPSGARRPWLPNRRRKPDDAAFFASAGGSTCCGFSSCFGPPCDVPAISMRRGFIASGTSRARSITSNPSLSRAPVTLT